MAWTGWAAAGPTGNPTPSYENNAKVHPEGPPLLGGSSGDGLADWTVRTGPGGPGGPGGEIQPWQQPEEEEAELELEVLHTVVLNTKEGPPLGNTQYSGKSSAGPQGAWI
eukprot:1182785-Prorocentrum_minimum.AAC.5